VRALRRLGGTVLTECAVRTVETQAGRVSGVITEQGALPCEAVVLAGGAWSRLFCGNLGFNLPQLKVLGSVLRTRPIPEGPEISVAGSQFAFRRCIDGSYCVASSGQTTAQITPDSFRLLGAFLPVLRKERKNIRLRAGRQFLEELLQPRRWKPDAETPFEYARVLDPRPDDAQLDQALAALREADPSFAAATEAKRWGGLIDVTPDAVPVISSVAALPGFYIATGFSGHGFGLGPGAGRLMADLVTGAAPVVDPSPFRFSRFSDGSRTVLDVGLSVSRAPRGT
jgi:glycine/D-amino acid oxidase-like deaminating enzyme